MTIGPGRIERAIAATFFAQPSMTYTVEELAMIAYPGLNRIGKKHRVAVRRAANKVAAREGWAWTQAERPGQPIVYFNLLDHCSYGIGQVRGCYAFHAASHAEVVAAMGDPKWGCIPADEWKKMMLPGGVFWLEVEINRAERWQDHDQANSLRAALAGGGDEV